ncbi:glycoside hydrolase family 3 protein [Paenibacillus sp. GCM10027629]|uniref:glycoside hydrolase family 3 protein n=1 Tax=Paenibacillus sp. GCM10027629 TaxID=3273414 RepID=UPI0036427633
MSNREMMRAKPFHLQEEDIDWVLQTLGAMTLEAKVGQLFCMHGMTEQREVLDQMLTGIQPGGVMFRPQSKESIRETHRYLQAKSNIPLLLAANLESGGSGIVTEGTVFANPMQIAATDDIETAERLGVVAAREGAAVGCNWSFAPVVDIDMNFRNPITNVRTYGSDPKVVSDMSRTYVKVLQEHGLAASIKHFPGDGVDDRDQHLLTAVNTLSVEEWDATFGQVYLDLIDAGAKTVMAGHIRLPAYSKQLNPALGDQDVMPATLAPELLNGLLRERLGFNGLIVSDSTMMAGFTMAAKREWAVPMCIAAGCDMFLFNRDVREDIGYMFQGIRTGLLSLERVDEAVTRILALKASLGLHLQDREALVPTDDANVNIGCNEHQAWAAEAANKAVTLVKDTEGLLPLDPRKTKRVLLVPIEPKSYKLAEEGFYSSSITEPFARLLSEEGFEVTVFEPGTNPYAAFMEGAGAVRQRADLVIYTANLPSANLKPTLRLEWSEPFNENLPWFLHELPTVFVSFANPYHLYDLPRVPVYVNAYLASEHTVRAVVNKLVGASSFEGRSPVDPFCGSWDARF